MVHCRHDVFMRSWCSHCDRKKKGKQINTHSFLFPHFVFAVCSNPSVCLGPRVCEPSPATLLVFHSTVCRQPPVTSGPLSHLPRGCGMLQREVPAASLHGGMLCGRAKSLYFWRRQFAALVLLKNGSRENIKGAFPLAFSPFFPEQDFILMLHVGCDENTKPSWRIWFYSVYEISTEAVGTWFERTPAKPSCRFERPCKRGGFQILAAWVGCG